MNLNWSAGEYEMVISSRKEHQLVLDTLVEAAYIVDGLPDIEFIARFGRTNADMQRSINEWREFRSPRNLSIGDLELVRSCFLETLDFFSESDYRLRTGWAKEEACGVLSDLLKDRKRITIHRQWG